MLNLALAFVALVAMTTGEEAILQLLPPDGVPEGWVRAGEPRIFAGDALFRHIDGGAELFKSYGFDRLALQDYSKGELEVRIEIYKMNDADGASGVFAENSKGIELAGDYGEACTLDDYQIVFHRGRYYVSVTCYEPSEEVRTAMAALAATVDEAVRNDE